MLTEEQEKALLEEIDKLRQDKAALISRVASLEQSLYWLRKKVFGRMSEKNLPLDPNQLFLFSKEEMSSMEISRMEDEVRKSDEEITRTIKVKEKPSRKPLDTSSLPVEVVDLYPEGTTDGEGRLKDDFIEIGKEESSRLERVPAKVYILKTVRHKVIRKSDMEKYPEERQILIHPLPLVPVSKCMAGASVLTDIIIGKFMYHLPFYRLIQQYRESGIIISESTCADGMKWRWRNSGFCTTCSNRRYSPVSIYKWTRVSFLCWTMRNIRRKRGMSGAYATASRGTSCSIMTVAAVRAW